MTPEDKHILSLPVSVAGRLIYRLLPWRKRVVMANIHQVYGDALSQSSKDHLAMAFYSHMVRSVREMIHMRFMSQRSLMKRVTVKGHEQLLNVAKEGKGVLVLTGHFGNWEFAPLGGILNFKQFQGQFHFIRRTLDAKWLEKILFRRYFKAGLNIIPKKNAMAGVMSALDANHAVIFVLDQHAIIDNRDGIAVEFFGKKAGTYRSLATLSRNTGVPVVPAAGYRLPNGTHVLEFFEPIHWQDYQGNQEALYQNTLAYNRALERIILAHPEQWAWVHKRWKI